jgi:hypothetical protein
VAAAENASAPQEEWDVGAQTRRKPVLGVRIHSIPREALEAQECRRGVTASAPQARARGDVLLQSNFDPSTIISGLPPKFAGLVDEIAVPGWNCGIGALETNRLARFR